MSSSATEVQCQLDIQTEIEPGVLSASVKINNLGNALLAVTGERNKGYTLLPRIATLSHHTGSLVGEQLLTITGAYEPFLGQVSYG